MLDIAPSLAGTLMGIINALGNTMGFVAPMIVGYMINNHNDREHWQVRAPSVICLSLITHSNSLAASVLDSGRGLRLRDSDVHHIWVSQGAALEQRPLHDELSAMR